MKRSEHSTEKELQTQINDALAKGEIVEVVDYGRSLGPICECCGRTGIDFVMVLSYEPGNKDTDDEASQCMFLLGKGCKKKFRFKAAKK